MEFDESTAIAEHGCHSDSSMVQRPVGVTCYKESRAYAQQVD